MNGGVNSWAITPEERSKHDRQFDSLTPTLGYVSGEQARKFFLQSGLPASVLAEIWSLADLTCDGRMDRLEFSIAMKLIKLQLQGQPLPSSLPVIMKQTPTPSIMTSSVRFGMGSMPNLSLMPTSAPTTIAPGLLPLPLRSTLPPPLVPLRGVPMPPMPTSLSTPALPNGVALGYSLLTPSPVAMTTVISTSTSFPPGPSLSKACSLLDLGSSSSNSSSTTSLASISPKKGSSDWAVPQATRLKYRQQFNSLDKLMSGYLSGPQVRNALTASNLTQTQLATIWNLADVDQDGQLHAEEFILAMHLVDLAKTGQPLPLSLPLELVPPSFRTMNKSSEMVNGTAGPPLCPAPADLLEPDLPQKTKTNEVSFEDKLKENFQRGSAELEKRRQALQEEVRRDEAHREEARKEEERQRQLREARHQEALRAQEQERRLQRQRELDRQREEERRRETEKIEELQRRRQQEQNEINHLQARKRSLQLELEAVGNKHKQISDCLRDARSKQQIQRAEVELVSQRRDGKITEISSLQLQLEDFQRQLSQLIPEQQRLQERLRTIGLNNSTSSKVSSAKNSVSVKQLGCRKLKEQLDALERETTAKLSEMDQYNKDLKDLREKQTKQQLVLDGLMQVKEEKVKELQRKKKEMEERKKKEEEAATRRAQLELELALQLQRQEEERQQQRQLQQEREREAQLWEQEQIEAQTLLQQAQEQAQEEERRRVEEQEKRRKEEEEGEAVARQPVVLLLGGGVTNDLQAQLSALFKGVEDNMEVRPPPRKCTFLTPYQALYPFTARNADELTLEAGGLVEVNEGTVGEPGWFYGSCKGKLGWFPQSYVEKCPLGETKDSSLNTIHSEATDPTTRGNQSTGGLAQGDAQTPGFASGLEDAQISTFSSSISNTAGTPHTQPEQVKALCSWTAKAEGHLSFFQGDLIMVLQRQENWWLGELKGTQGWFPKSYVSLAIGGVAGPEQLYSAVDDSDCSDVCQLEEFVALYTYESPEVGDLTFNVGDTILVMEREGEWWRGCIGDHTGVFPSNYVKPREPGATKPGATNKKPEIVQVTMPSIATTAEQLSLTTGQLILVLAKNSSGWWLGELQARGKKRQRGWFPSTNIKVLGVNSDKYTPTPQPTCQVIAMYDYKAANEDEMSFFKGQLINVLNQDNIDWWKGEVNGVTGLFPTNYVKMTTESDLSQQSHLLTERRKVAALLLLHRRQRRFWIHPINQRRREQGAYHNLVQELALDTERHQQYFRMSPTQMEEILSYIGEDITKQATNYREPIEAKQRLAVTMRYLATGETFSSLAFSYRLGERTVSKVIEETCDAIIRRMKSSQLPIPTLATWIATARRFEEKTQFPHCIGALDGKHIHIFAPPNSGSQFFNYKKTFSVVLLALVDADYRIITLQIGDFGRCSDGGVFAHSALGRGLQQQTLNLPAPEFIPGFENLGPMPYTFVADAAFPLKPNLMRPYPGHHLSPGKNNFNYRLSKARNVVEDTFGILSVRWRILLTRIMLTPDKVDKVVLTTCILHNYLIKQTDYSDNDRSRPTLQSVQTRAIGNRGCNAAYDVRDNFCAYFNSPAGRLR